MTQDDTMRHHRVESQMTTDVVRVRETTPFTEIVRLLREHRIAAVPVVDGDDRVLGVVSESDLLRKEADQEGPAPFALQVISRSRVRAARDKASAAVAAELMTSPAVVVEPGLALGEAARVMEHHHVTHLPVVDESGRLRGIVSRGDLLAVFLRPDDHIRDEIRHDVLGDELRIDPTAVDIRVRNGVVDLAGQVERKSLVAILTRMCRGVDGVVLVREQLTYAHDDMRIRPPMVPPLADS